MRLAIDYVNPDDRTAKPPAVQTVVETLAPGSRIDTSVPARCGASDAELMRDGATACPTASRVGGGQVDLDTGTPGPGRIVQNRVTMFNNKDELVLLFEPSGASGRVVSRSPITGGRTITAGAPPIPGGPPDGFTALKKVRLGLDAISTGTGTSRRSYVTTPDSCPRSGSWTNQISFTYRDRETQTTTSRSPCRGDQARDRSRPRIRIAGVPRRCARRGFRARVRIRDHSPLRRASMRLDGRRVRFTKRKRFAVRVPARRVATGRHRLSVVARDRAGNRSTRTVRFRAGRPDTCAR